MRVPTKFALVLVPALAVSADAQTAGVREISVSARTVVPLDTKVRYTTMILLPDDEEILDVVCGDRDYWVISAAQNIAHIKPAKAGAETNLNLVTASGMVYSFLLTEGKTPAPDLKLYVTKDASLMRTRPVFVPATQVTALEAALTDARAAVDTATHRADDAIATFRRHYPTTLQFDYHTPPYGKPFYVRAIWHDERFTYIKSDARDLPALYAFEDGQPALVNFQVDQGTYIVPKVLETAYLALGKVHFVLQREH
jgi:type IV secretion system protein VirB9